LNTTAVYSFRAAATFLFAIFVPNEASIVARREAERHDVAEQIAASHDVA
jgi:hypothetical protein